MEKIENGCIILKQKEYDELVIKSKENRAKEIKISYGYCRNFEVAGDFQLSSKLYNQVYRIIQTIDKKCQSMIKEDRTDIAYAAKAREYNFVVGQFEKLHWTKRLFFKKEYIISSND